MMEKENVLNIIEDDIDRRNRNWDKVDALKEDVNDRFTDVGQEINGINGKLNAFRYFDSAASSSVGRTSIALTKPLVDGMYLLFCMTPIMPNDSMSGLYIVMKNGTKFEISILKESTRLSNVTYANSIPTLNFNTTVYPKVIVYSVMF